MALHDRHQPLQEHPGAQTLAGIAVVNGVDEEVGIERHQTRHVDEAEVMHTGVLGEHAVLERRQPLEIAIAERRVALIEVFEDRAMADRMEDHAVLHQPDRMMPARARRRPRCRRRGWHRGRAGWSTGAPEGRNARCRDRAHRRPWATPACSPSWATRRRLRPGCPPPATPERGAPGPNSRFQGRQPAGGSPGRPH